MTFALLTSLHCLRGQYENPSESSFVSFKILYKIVLLVLSLWISSRITLHANIRNSQEETLCLEESYRMRGGRDPGKLFSSLVV